MLLLNDWQSTPLTVSDITSLNVQVAQFASLSAYETASIRDHCLLDKSIHLGSAMLLAGYPSVVGTLWRVTDKHCVNVVKEVYSWMLQGNKLNNQRAAEGLSRAVRAIRDKTTNVPRSSKK